MPYQFRWAAALVIPLIAVCVFAANADAEAQPVNVANQLPQERLEIDVPLPVDCDIVFDHEVCDFFCYYVTKYTVEWVQLPPPLDYLWEKHVVSWVEEQCQRVCHTPCHYRVIFIPSIHGGFSVWICD
ncbi:MAG: hypothetical protein OXH38_01690 [Chloroflexi bacterium]|nr:hypothetical protein [Chloroflexota bacterium]MYB21455.1 hypothetical protein [Chloroflexota bacterium]MYF81938.1 hypothetical protein [Chloroflexota bacterium]MYI04534.1 hypothetical protein [Chloroflexota bacterium]